MNPSIAGTLPTELLWCPLHERNVTRVDSRLMCAAGHEISTENGVPIFAAQPRREPKPFNMPPLPHRNDRGAVDGFVDDWIVNTKGNLYWRVRGSLPRYPIPSWPARMPRKPGGGLVDMRCRWGSWTIAGARV